MAYRFMALWAASMAIAQSSHNLPAYGKASSSYPRLSLANGTGILPTGTAYSAAVPTGIGKNSSTKATATGPSILMPIVPDSHNTSHPDNMIPQSSQTLHYAENGITDRGQGMKAAQVHYDFHYPSVPLEHIGAVKDIQCPSNTEIRFVFDNSNMFQMAIGSWPKSGTRFILIDGTEGCGKSQQRTFFSVDKYSTNKSDLSVRATGRMLSGGDPSIIKAFDVDWQHGAASTATSSSNSASTPAPTVGKRGLIGDIRNHFSAAESAVKNALPTLAKTAATKLTLNEAPAATDKSPWGPAKKLGTADGITMYCVDCGFKGGLALSGSISAGFTSPFIRSGSVDFETTDLNIPMVFGFEAQNAFLGRSTLSVNVVQIGLDPFSVPDVFVIGPYVSLGVDFSVTLGATGNLEAGVTMSWPNAKAHLDLTDPKGTNNSQSGFIPTVQNTWKPSAGQVTLNGSIGVPLSLGVGVIIANDLFQINASISDTPSIGLDTIFSTHPKIAKRSHPRELDARQAPADPQCTAGIQEIVKFQDTVGLNVGSLWRTALTSWVKTVGSTCIETGAKAKRTAPAATLTSLTANVVATTPAAIFTTPAGPVVATTTAATPTTLTAHVVAIPTAAF